MITSLMLISLASAQETIVSQGDTPLFNSQSFRPAIDSHKFLWVNETELGTQSSFNYRTTFSYANSPVVYRDFLGEEIDLLSSLSQIDLSAGYTQGKIRYALTAPIVLRAAGDAIGTGNELGLGEAMADLKWQYRERNDEKLGMALNVRTSLPTSTLESPLGTEGLMFEVESAIDMQLGNNVLVFNLGHRQQPTVPTEDVTWGPQLFSRLGYAIPFGEEDRNGVALETNFAGLYSHMSFKENGISVESMLSGWFSVKESVQIRAGLSKGLASGMTTPNWRGVMAVSVLQQTERDTDGDGVADYEDKCVDEAEDIDGFEDNDGCAEPTKVNVFVRDHLGHEVHDASWRSTDEQFSGQGYSSFYTRGGVVALNIDDKKYKSEVTEFVIQDQAEQSIIFEVELLLGDLMVIVKDENEKIIPKATWSIDGIKGALFQPIGVPVAIKPGTHEVVVVADGYRMIKKEIVVEASEMTMITLSSAKLRVTKDLKVLEKVFFKTGSHEIDERSHILLDEVADVLKHYKLIELVHIEGHTDSQGSNKYNKTLSQARASEVRQYLINKGVEEKRLVAIGYGEERPISSNATEDGRRNNRRVLFEIKKVHEGDFSGQFENMEVINNSSEVGETILNSLKTKDPENTNEALKELIELPVLKGTESDMVPDSE